MLTESQRRWLTEYIGECWHTLTAFLDNGIIECSCGARMSRGPDEATFHVEQENNRTFTTWADLGVVKEAIEKAGRWSQFEDFTFWEWQKIPLTEMTTHMQWLIDPARFCDLAGEWLKQKG